MMTEELKMVIENHKKWLDGDSDGVKAVLIGDDLSGADLAGANLSFAVLFCANLSGSDLSKAFLIGTDLTGANLSNANLRYADLTYASLRSANLSFSNLVGVNMLGTALYGSKLDGANLNKASMIGTDLHHVDISKVKCMPFIPYICPDFGSFTGWKKAAALAMPVIVELEIPEDAKRLSGAGRQCRCDKAKVVSISALDGSAIEYNEAFSLYDPCFVYRIGETVSVSNFDENRWAVCAAGIHFFINRQEAVEYRY